MDINSNTTVFTNLNTTWDNNLETLHVHLDQIPLCCSSSSWSNCPYPLQIPCSSSSPSSSLSLFSSSLMPSSGGFLNNVVLEEDDEEADAEEEQLGTMKEMLYKIAAMQPLDIDPATIRKPKRRNVRISDDPQSVAARHRRERISEKIRILQRLVPGGTKMDTASMLDEAIRYVKFLKRQIRLLQSQPPPAPPQQCSDVTNALPMPGVGFNNTAVPSDHWPFAPPNLLSCHTTTTTNSSSSALNISAALGFTTRDGSGSYDQES